MILQEDKNNEYKHQLTKGFVRPERLEFAVKHFRDDLDIHCVIKEENCNGTKYYSVYTKGESYLIEED